MIQLFYTVEPIGGKKSLNLSVQFHHIQAKPVVSSKWDNCSHQECFNLHYLRFLLESSQLLLSLKPTSRISETRPPRQVPPLPPPTATVHPI